MKQHNSFDARCRETPENCMLFMVSAHDKVGVTLVNAELHQVEKSPQNTFKYRKWDISLLKSAVFTYRVTTQSIVYNFRSERENTFTPDSFQDLLMAIAHKSLF